MTRHPHGLYCASTRLQMGKAERAIMKSKSHTNLHFITRSGWEFEKSVCQTCSCPSYEVQHDAIPQGPWEPIPEPEIWNCGLPRLHWIWTSGKSGRSHSVSFLSLLNLTTITVYQVLLFTCCLWFFIFGQWQKVESVQSFENSAKNIIFFRGNWDWTH